MHHHPYKQSLKILGDTMYIALINISGYFLEDRIKQALYKRKCDDEAFVYSLLDLSVINGEFQWSLNYMMQLQASPSAFQFPASGNNVLT